MDDTSWLVPAVFGVIIAIAVVTFVGNLIMDMLKTRRNRVYKSLDEHRGH